MSDKKALRCARAGEGDVSQFKVMGRHHIKPDAGGFIYWHLVNFTPDQDKFKTILAFTQAFDAWQAAMDQVPPLGRFITFKSTNDFHQAHIRLFFIAPNTEDQVITTADGKILQFKHKWPLDGNGGIVAHVPLDETNIYFDEGENWGEMFRWEGDNFFAPLMTSAEHEIGHVLDLDHSKEDSDIMSGIMEDRVRIVTQDSIKGLKAAGWDRTKAKFQNTPTAATVVKPALSGTDLIMAALKYYGLKEVAGPGSQDQIIAMIRSMFPASTDDSAVAWCAIFINWIMKEIGMTGTGSGLARSFLKWGQAVAWEDRKPGDLAVFWRGSPEASSGHVAIYVNDHEKGETYLRVLGGNQSDQVSIADYPRERLLELRRYV